MTGLHTHTQSWHAYIVHMYHMYLYVCVYIYSQTHICQLVLKLCLSLNNALEQLLFSLVTKLLSSLDSLCIK